MIALRSSQTAEHQHNMDTHRDHPSRSGDSGHDRQVDGPQRTHCGDQAGTPMADKLLVQILAFGA